MDILSAAVGFAIGGLLSGGSVTHVTNNNYTTNIIPILLHFDEKTRRATITCPKCGGTGSVEREHSCSSCRYGFDYCTHHSCRACGGSKIQVIIIPKELWKKSLEKAEKQLKSTTK